MGFCVFALSNCNAVCTYAYTALRVNVVYIEIEGYFTSPFSVVDIAVPLLYSYIHTLYGTTLYHEHIYGANKTIQEKYSPKPSVIHDDNTFCCKV